MRDGTRYLGAETIKVSLNSLKDFETYWRKHDEIFLKQNSYITQEEVEDSIKGIMDDIRSDFKEGDEIIHFDDYGVAIKKCEREYVLIRREGKVIKSILIRMS